MADVVENRVVEMRFDNKDFETNAQQSIKTLDQLDKSLEFKNSSKGFEDINKGIKSVDFSSLHSEVSNIDNAFMSLAGSIKRNFIDEISEGIIGLGKTLWENTIGQIKSGGKQRALNIEQAKFKVKGLNEDWDKVHEDMDYAVSGTAYGIDAAANAAAQFLASGVQKGDDMKAALRGISGVAAMTSSDYSEIARVFTAAAGKGRVQAIELNRLSLRGINAAAALAKYIGATEAEVREMSRKGEIDFNTFAAAMDSAFGEHAKKANETFTGSLSNVKAALSRIGEIFYEPWLKNMIPVNNRLRESIDKIKNALKQTLYTVDGREMDSIAGAIADINKFTSRLVVEFLNSLNPALDRLPYRLEHVYDWLMNIRHFLKGGVNTFKTLNTYLEDWQNSMGGWNYEKTGYKRALQADKSYVKEEWKIAREIVQAKQYTADYEAKLNKDQEKTVKEKKLSISHINDIIDMLTYKEQDSLKKVTDAEYKKAQSIYNSGKYNKVKGILYNEQMKAELQEEGMDIRNVQKVLDTLSDEKRVTKGGFSALVDALTKGEVLKSPLHETGAQILLKIYQDMYMAWRALQLAFEKVRKVARAIKIAFDNVEHTFRGMQWTSYSIVDAFTALIKKFVIAGQRGNAIKRIFQGIFSIGKLAQWAWGRVITFITELFDKTGETGPVFLNFLANFGDYFYALANAIINGGEAPSLIGAITAAIGDLIDGIKNLLGGEGKIAGFFEAIWNFLGNIVNVVSAIIQSIVGGTGSIFDAIVYALVPPETDPTGETASRVGTFLANISDIFIGLVEFAATVAKNLADIFDFVWGVLKDKGTEISDLIGALLGFFTKLIESFEPTKNTEGPSAMSKLKEVFFAFCDALIAVFNSMAETLPAIKDPLIAMSESLVKMITSVSDTIAKILKWISDDPEAAYGMAAFFSVMELLIKWLENHKNIGWKPFATSFQEFLGTVAKAIYNYCTPTVAKKLSDFGTAALKFAIAIAITIASITGAWGMVGQITGHWEESTAPGHKMEFVEGETEFMPQFAAVVSVLGAMLLGFAALMKKLAGYDVNPMSTMSTSALIQAMANAILEIAIAIAAVVAVLAIIDHLTGIDGKGMKTFKTVGLIMSGILILLGAFVIGISLVIKNIAPANLGNLAGGMFALSILIIAFSLSVKSIMHSIVDLMFILGITMAIADAAGVEPKTITQLFAVSFAVIVLVMELLVGIIQTIGKHAYSMANSQPLNLIGVAVIMAVMGHVLKVIIEQIVVLIGAITASKMISGKIDSVIAAALVITIVMTAMAGFLAIMTKMNFGTGMVDAVNMLAIAAILLAMCIVIRAAALAVVELSNTDISSEAIWTLIGIMAGVAILTALFTKLAGTLSMSTIGGLVGIFAVLLGIAAGAYLTAKAFWLLSEAFLDLAVNWEDVREIIPTMLDDIGNQMPKFAKVVGSAVREFCIQIMKTAPTIALAVIVLLLSVSAILSANATFLAGHFLIAIDGILNALLIGAVVILPKLLALGMIFLSYIEANVTMLATKLTSIILKAVFGACLAIGDMFTDFLPKWVDENFDKLENNAFIRGLSTMALADKIGDWIWKKVNGQSYEDYELEEALKQYEELGHSDYLEKKYGLKPGNDEAEMMIQYGIDERGIKDKVARSQKEFNQKWDKAMAGSDMDVSTNAKGEINVEPEVKYPDKQQIEETVKSAYENSPYDGDVKNALKEQGIDVEQGIKMENAGENDAGSYFTGLLTNIIGEDRANEISGALKKAWSGSSDVSANAGEEAADSFFGSMINRVNEKTGEGGFFKGIKDKLLGGINLDGFSDMFPNLLTGSGMTQGAMNNLNLFGSDGSFDAVNYTTWMPDMNQYGMATSGENMEEVMQQISDVNNGNGIFGFTTDWMKSTTDQNSENTSILGKIKEGLEYVTNHLGDSIVMPKNSYIKLQNKLDAKVMSEATLPITETLEMKKLSMKENRMAVKTGQ